MKNTDEHMNAIEYTSLLRDAVPGDFEYIDSLRKKEGSALGFLPKDAYMSVLHKKRIANRDRWKYQRIWVVEDNLDLTGYCYASFSGDPATIIQIVIQDDARRWHRAMMLESAVESEARLRGLCSIKCRVALDLESNAYWRAIGYIPVETVTSTWLNQRESKSKRTIVVYHKDLGLPLFGAGHDDVASSHNHMQTLTAGRVTLTSHQS
jgi:predicted GNAT superfamily acetyltransferase